MHTSSESPANIQLVSINLQLVSSNLQVTTAALAYSLEPCFAAGLSNYVY